MKNLFSRRAARILVLCAMSALLSCQKSSNEGSPTNQQVEPHPTSPAASSPGVREQLESQLNKLTDAVSRLTPARESIENATGQELQKLLAFEYKVLEVPIEKPAVELEAALALLGQDRWECYDSHQNADHLRVLCKRRPQSYLRYIPRWFP